MSYETKMYLQLAKPCVLVLMMTPLFAWVASTLSDVLVRLGGQELWPDLSFYVASAGMAVFLCVSVFQLFRLWQRERGKEELCFVCGCLLGDEKEGRRGLYRKCLGCGSTQSLSHY